MQDLSGTTTESSGPAWLCKGLWSAVAQSSLLFSKDQSNVPSLEFMLQAKIHSETLSPKSKAKTNLDIAA